MVTEVTAVGAGPQPLEHDEYGGPYLTVPELARILNMSELGLRKLLWRGDLRSYRIGNRVRVRRDDLNEFLERCEQRQPR